MKPSGLPKPSGSRRSTSPAMTLRRSISFLSVPAQGTQASASASRLASLSKQTSVGPPFMVQPSGPPGGHVSPPTKASLLFPFRSAAAFRQQRRSSSLNGISGVSSGTSSVPVSATAAAAQLPTGLMPPTTSCLDGSLVVHNMLASFPVTSPFVVLRALTAALRRQAARQRRSWWSGLIEQAAASVSGTAYPAAPSAQQKQRPLRPAHPIVHFYNFLRGIPLWLRQRRLRGNGELSFDQVSRPFFL